MIDETIKMVKYQYIPTLSGSFAYNFMAMGDDFDIKWNPYSVVGISLNIPIFDGFPSTTVSSNIKWKRIS